jgi:hypothetical protein
MRVGGKKGGPKRPGGAGGVGGGGGVKSTGKVGGAGFGGKVDKNASVEGASVAPSSAAGPASPMVLEALSIVKKLQDGQIPSKAHATGELVTSILKEKMGKRTSKNRGIVRTITDTIQEDPHIQAVLERIWSHRD